MHIYSAFDIETKLSDLKRWRQSRRCRLCKGLDRWGLMMQALLADRFQLKTASETTKDASV